MLVPWVLATGILLVLPQIFSANSAITIMNQMAITIVFALSYNMLLGQAGMLSFGHAVYMGGGGFMCLHILNYVADNALPIPLPILPLFAGLFSMGIAMCIGGFSTRRGGTSFAMISLGIVELVASFSIIIVTFFSYGGAGGDRTTVMAFFGVDFAQQTEVYYLIIFWLVTTTALMYLFTRTPVGRMANAVRDNPERAQFLGYSARWIRFYSFCGAGFFAGIAGGLSAINYEIATAENLTVEASGTILLATFLGGVGAFFGPILGAIVFTLLQTVLSFETDLWQLYLGVLFLAAVMFFPSGLAGLLTMHIVAIRAKNARQLIATYVKTLIPAIFATLSLAALAEMLFHIRAAAVGEHETTLFWITFSTQSPIPWLLAVVIAISGIVLAKRAAPDLIAAWENLTPR